MLTIDKMWRHVFDDSRDRSITIETGFKVRVNTSCLRGDKRCSRNHESHVPTAGLTQFSRHSTLSGRHCGY